MSGDLIIYAFGGFAVAAAAVVVFGKNLFRNVIAFTAMLLATAGLLATVGADFLAIVQLFVYVGGVVVLILFGLMLTASGPAAPVLVDSRHSLVGAVAAAGLVLMTIPAVAAMGHRDTLAAVPGGTSQVIGRLLLTSYAPAFEVVGVVLLVAAIAAISILKRGEA